MQPLESASSPAVAIFVDSFNEELWYGKSADAQSAAEVKAAKSLAAQVGSILGARPFPITAQRLSTLTLDPSCPMVEVVELLESDPALSARLLRLVNSAGFALRTACTSVGHAAALVGIQKLNQVATTAAILDMYDGAGETAAGVLEHVTVVGALSRYLGVHFGLPPDELFTCGFLHDIGKLMLLDCEGELYAEILELAKDQPDIAHLKERQMLGYDHADLAGQVLSAWNIPEPIPKVVAWHHQAPRTYNDPLVARMVAVLRLADAISYSIFRPFPDHEIERLARLEAASYMEISQPQFASMWMDLYALAEKSRAGFRGEQPRLEETHLAEMRRHLGQRALVQGNSQRAAKVPRNFPCVVCGVPSYASQCPACQGYVCPSHQLGTDEWCSLCVDEFNAVHLHFPSWAYIGGAVLTGSLLLLSALGASNATGANLQVFVAPALVAALVIVVVGAWLRWFRRFWFLHRTPDRTRAAPKVTDDVAAGTSPYASLAPPPPIQRVDVFSPRSMVPSAPLPQFATESSSPAGLDAPTPSKRGGSASLSPLQPPLPQPPPAASQAPGSRRMVDGEAIGVSSDELGPGGVFTSAPPPRSTTAQGLLEEFADLLGESNDGSREAHQPGTVSLRTAPKTAQVGSRPPLVIESSAAPPPPHAFSLPPPQDPSQVTHRTPRAWKAVDGAHGSADGW